MTPYVTPALVMLWITEGEIFGVEFSFHAGGEDGYDVCGEGRGEQEGEEIGDEADAGVVEEGHLCVEPFFCFCRCVLGDHDTV